MIAQGDDAAGVRLTSDRSCRRTIAYFGPVPHTKRRERSMSSVLPLIFIPGPPGLGTEENIGDMPLVAGVIFRPDP